MSPGEPNTTGALLSGNQLKLSGHWTLANFEQLRTVLARLPTASGSLHLDFSAVESLDTAGASLLLDWLGPEHLAQALSAESSGLSSERQALLRLVISSEKSCPASDTPPATSSWVEVLLHIGQTVDGLFSTLRALLGFLGLVLSTLGRSLLRPRRWRVTSLVAHIEQTGLDAVPIVALLTFLVGAVVAFLGATVLADFGATLYTVDLVVFSFLREFAVLLTAILMAGRTASAFTAQIGSMKANEEIDALRTQGLDPIELLVLPRVLAMLVVLPLLTFIGMLSGIVGGAMVCIFSLDISPAMFLSIVQSNVDVSHFWIGLSKAPVFAFLIAIIGCLEGFKVTGNARSVGAHTTSSVVQSIFAVILLDAVAAMFFMEMGW